MTRSHKFCKRRRFRGNQYTQSPQSTYNCEPEPIPSTSTARPSRSLECDSGRPTDKKAECMPQHSASFLKIGKTDKPCNKPTQSTYILMDLDILTENLRNFARCSKCGKGEVVLSEIPESRMGCATKIKLLCKECDAMTTFMTSKKTQTCMFDINVRFVYALRSIGSGLENGRMLCTLLDIPGPPTNFMKYNRVIDPIIKKVADDCMIEAVQEVIEKTESTDIAVAVDGSWQKRGFSSLNGVVTVTSMETGNVIDTHVMSKYCHGCKLAAGSDEKLRKHETVCELNYEGNSGGMEVEGAKAIFCRSQSKRGVRYLTYLGDGDSKGHASVCEVEPYGPDVTVTKAECIGHVKKRMGARLRKLCKMQKKGEKLSDGKGLSGKGRLTLVDINNLQEYYGKAIKMNCHDVSEMKRAIWSIYFHKLSTDENPQHQLCPKGETSWCGYNRGLATNEKYLHKHSLPEAVLSAIKPIFKDLSNDVLLKRCTLGQTQNPNESFNALIWKRLPKTVFCGMVTLRVGVHDAVLAYNKGAVSKLDVLNALGLKCSENVRVRLQRCDAKRVTEAERKVDADMKKKRKFQRLTRIKKEEAGKHEDYDPGMF